MSSRQHRVRSPTGPRIGYRTPIWATGGCPRRLSCAAHKLKGVHVVRTRADVDTILEELDGATRVAVIGGGYIGLEVAAVLNTRQIRRSHRGAAPGPGRGCRRVACASAKRSIGREASTCARVQVERIEGRRGRVCGYGCGAGASLPADVVIVGVDCAGGGTLGWRPARQAAMAPTSMRSAARALPTTMRLAIVLHTRITTPRAHASAWNRCRTPMIRRPWRTV